MRIPSPAVWLLVVVCGVGACRTASDGDGRWNPVGLGGSIVRALAVDPQSHTILAGTSDRGLVRRDAAGTWASIAVDGTTTHDVRAIAVDPRAPGTTYIATARGRVFKTTDGGASWRDCPLAGTDERTPVLALAIDPADSTRLFAGTARGGLLASTDSGATWTRLESAAVAIALTDVVALAVDPAMNGRTVYASTSGRGVVRSVDGGATWQPMNGGLTVLAVQALAIAPRSSTVYAATSGGGVFVARGGDEWRPTSGTGRVVWSLAIDDVHGAVYAGASGGAVFVSRDEGATWLVTAAALADSVWSLAIDAPADTVYAGTSGHGIFASRRPLALSVAPSPTPAPPARARP